MSLRAPADAARCVLIAYDVSDDARRRAVAKVLLRVGLRIQYSLFELWLPPGALPPIINALSALIEPRLDRIDIIPVCATCTPRWRRLGATAGPPLPWQVL